VNRKIFAVSAVLVMMASLFFGLPIRAVMATTPVYIVSQYEYIPFDTMNPAFNPNPTPFGKNYTSYGCSLGFAGTLGGVDISEGIQLEESTGQYQTCARRSGTKRSYHYKTPSGRSELWASGIFRFEDGIDTLDDNNDRIGIIAMYDEDSWGVGSVRARYLSSESKVLFDIYSRDGASGTSSDVSDLEVENGVNYIIELYVKVADAGNVSLWVNGNLEATMSVDNNAGGDDIDEIRFGLPFVINNEGATDLRADAVVLASCQIGTGLVYGNGFPLSGSYSEAWTFAGDVEGEWTYTEADNPNETDYEDGSLESTFSMGEYCGYTMHWEESRRYTIGGAMVKFFVNGDYADYSEEGNHIPYEGNDVYGLLCSVDLNWGIYYYYKNMTTYEQMTIAMCKEGIDDTMPAQTLSATCGLIGSANWWSWVTRFRFAVRYIP